MLTSLALAFIAGLVTILNPCVLPLVPILIGSALSQSRIGPAALAAGLVTSFTVFGFAFIAFGYSLGIDERMVRMFAGVLLVLAGAVLLFPRAQAAITAAGAPIAQLGNEGLARVNQMSSADGALTGGSGQYAVGLLLGLVWAPCVGPTLGVAIAAASQGEDLLASFVIFATFGLGVATSILAFAYGSRKALGERRAGMQALARYAKPVFAIALMLVGALVLSGWDKMIEIAILDSLPPEVIAFTTQF